MKHIKRFNLITEKSLSPNDISSISLDIEETKITPQTDQISIRAMYDFIYLELESRISISGYEYKYIMIDNWQAGSLYFYSNLDDAAIDFPDDYCHEFGISESESWDGFKSQLKNKLVNILEYNDINFAEIENLFLNYNINIDTMWGVLV